MGGGAREAHCAGDAEDDNGVAPFFFVFFITASAAVDALSALRPLRFSCVPRWVCRRGCHDAAADV